MVKPDFRFEKGYWKKGYGVVIGVDEVGRGALAGPVVAGAVALKRGDSLLGIGIDDSKRLAAKKREGLAKIIRKDAAVGIGEVGVAYINRHGIVKATQKAMRKSIANLKLHKNPKIFVLVDAFHVKYIPGVGLENQKAIIKGDQKSISIAAASIIAKVYRDKLMVRLGKKYPKYKWRENKGYGTEKHLAAIKKHGPTKLHRLAFLPKGI